MSRKKILVLTLSMMLVVAVAIGGTTYALFTSAANNTGNAFSAGNVSITGLRDDVPFTGPMFYTDKCTPGALPTGLWAPGDRQTRGLFLDNIGTLEARLATLKAIPENPGDLAKVAADNTNFANNAQVIIWNLKWFRGTDFHFAPKLSAADIDKLMESVNDTYNEWANRNPRWWELTHYEIDQAYIKLIELVNAALLDTINKLDIAPQLNGSVIKVTNIYNDKLANLLPGSDVRNFDIKLPVDGKAMLGFTVDLDKSAGNELQGAAPRYTFATTWEQTRNNPLALNP